MSTGDEETPYWSGEVTRRSNALDLEPGVFTFDDPERVARSLKRSAEVSSRRKGTPYQSAMSMLNFYINRAGRNLSEERRRVLQQAKVELRKQFSIKVAARPVGKRTPEVGKRHRGGSRSE